MTNNRVINSVEAIREALSIIGEKYDNALLFGEGILDPSAFFGTTRGLENFFGHERIYEMPLSENAVCGVAIGTAVEGKHPIISFHRVEFALLAMEQIINNAAKMHYASNGIHTCPIILRLIVGRGWGQGPAHSQSLEASFAAVPGLKVIAPVFPYDYKGMLISAMEDKNPIIVIEHRWTHSLKGIVPTGLFMENITSPKKISQGNTCTIIATSYSVIEALQAVKVLENFELGIDLIDLRVLSPLNEDMIIESVKKTGSLITIDLGWKSFGVGAELIARVTERAWGYLKKAPIRLGLPDHPIPSSRGYLPGLYPSSRSIIDAVLAITGRDDLIKPVQDLFSKDPKELNLDVPNSEFQGPF